MTAGSTVGDGNVVTAVRDEVGVLPLDEQTTSEKAAVIAMPAATDGLVAHTLITYPPHGWQPCVA